MSNTLVINATNATSQKHIFNYNFINGSFSCNEKTKISISSISIPYSWFNVSSFYNNNKFSITWIVGSTVTTYPVELSVNAGLPDGFYSVTTINQFLQNFCIQNGFYLVNASGQNVYYFDLSYNPAYYAVQLLLFPIPTSLPVGWVQPANFVGYPSVVRCPQFILPATGSISSIIGFAPNTTYGLLSTANGQTFLSTLVPQGSIVNSVIVRCSLVENNIAMPSDILDSFPITSDFGSNIVYEPSFNKWVRLKSGKYNTFSITFNDEFGTPLPIRDTNVLITLLIKQD
jgi:hypothetical protein